MDEQEGSGRRITSEELKRKQSKRGPLPERPSKRSVRPDRKPNQSRALQKRRIIRKATEQDRTDLSKDLRGLSALNRVLPVDDRERNTADAKGRRLPVTLLNLRLERVRSKELLGLYRSMLRQERKGPRKISFQRGYLGRSSSTHPLTIEMWETHLGFGREDVGVHSLLFEECMVSQILLLLKVSLPQHTNGRSAPKRTPSKL